LAAFESIHSRFFVARIFEQSGFGHKAVSDLFDCD
jgi:hypothetical protein